MLTVRAIADSSQRIADLACALGIDPRRFSASSPPQRPGMFAAGASLPITTPAKRHPILDILGKLWGGTNTALGLAAASASYLAGKAEGTNPHFQIGNNAVQLLNSPLNVDNRAYTLGNVQVYGVGDGPDRYQDSYTAPNINTGRHEEGHTYQSQILGPAYLPVEMWGSLLGNKNPLEAGADKYSQGKSWTGF